MTKRGADPLLSAEENTAELIEPPTKEEMDLAITNNLSSLIVVVCSTVIDSVYIARAEYLADESSQEI